MDATVAEPTVAEVPATEEVATEPVAEIVVSEPVVEANQEAPVEAVAPVSETPAEEPALAATSAGEQATPVIDVHAIVNGDYSSVEGTPVVTETVAPTTSEVVHVPLLAKTETAVVPVK